jgi:hypothetical protein
MSRNPVAYIASNASSVLERSLNGDSDSSVSQSVSDPSPPNIHKPLKEASPLHVPHLYWRCLTSGKTNEFPMMFDALIDHGSSAALISEEYVIKLGLRCKRLREPYIAELAMKNDGQKNEVKFTEYVKVQLHVGFVTGIPRVGIFHTVPVPANTVPVTGTGTYRTRICAVSHETRGITHTRGIKIIKIIITKYKN